MSISGWIGVDLDGTLAEYHGWNNGVIGRPIPLMVERVKKWLAEGVTVKITTARVSILGGHSLESNRSANDEFAREQTEIIKAWCLEHIGAELEVTYCKDFAMIELWDDRAIQVIPNTGRRADGQN
jgi:hypothetical protein